jgi:hypothetical protein
MTADRLLRFRPEFRILERTTYRISAAAVAAASVALFLVSRGKWTDAIVDSGTEWLYADAISRGDVLYRDVVYWFGPFTPCFLAAFMIPFGSTFRALAAAGIVGSLAALAALYVALRTVAERPLPELWTAVAIPALVFMPESGGSILGMGYRIWHPATFALLAIAVAARPLPARSSLSTAIAAGALSAMAALSRLEWGLISLGAVLVCSFVRGGMGKPFLRDSTAAIVSFLLLSVAVLGPFIAAAGPRTVLEDGHLFLRGVSAETRTFLYDFAGIHQWRRGVLEMVYSAAAWAGIVFLIRAGALAAVDRPRFLRHLPLLAGLVLVLGLCAALGGAAGAVLFSAAPIVCIAAAIAGLFASPARRMPLLGFGVAGLLFLHRRPFHIRDGPYVAPSLLFAFVCAAALCQELVERERDPEVRERFRRGLTGAAMLLVLFGFLGRAVQYSGDDRVFVSGTQEMLSARPEFVPKISAIVDAVRKQSRPGDGLVVLPEGGVLNYLSERPNRTPYKLFIPGYLTDENEKAVLRALERAPPAAIVVLDRETPEYGRTLFGVDYGKRVRRWIEENYDVQPLPGSRPTGRAAPWTGLAIRKNVSSRRNPP